jgi:CDP-glycerol glycerophosphotransferase (TagB/SpsB family)
MASRKNRKCLKYKLLLKEKLKNIILLIIIITVEKLRALKLIKHRKIWLIGGASGRAYTDNSATLHSYLIKSHPELNVFWIANKNCKEIGKIINKSQVLYKSTIKLLIYIALAEVIVVSHSKSDIYTYNGKMVDNIFKVHLGHGANAFKKKIIKNKNKTLNIDFDLFIANSEYEKNIKISWGINSEKIIVTGMPRHDDLFKKSKFKEKNRQKAILYMPTWREWLDKDIIELERFNRELSNFAQTEKIVEVLERHGYKIFLYLHINMHKYYERIISKNNIPHFIKLPLNIDLQSFVASSDLLITDYSSIAWDFLILNKPVIFYQFDLNIFEHHIGSYIDMRNDLFGPSAYNLHDLTMVLSDHLNNTINTDFKVKMNDWKKKMFLYNDEENCKRVVEEINCRLNEKL